MTIFEGIIIKNGAIIIPESLRLDLLAKAHSRHQGIVRTKQYLRNAVYWPGMSSEIEKMCKDGRICRQLLPKEELPLSPVDRPEGPWIQIDNDRFSFEFHHYLTIQDFYSKWPEVYKLKLKQLLEPLLHALRIVFHVWKPTKTCFRQWTATSEFRVLCIS